MVGRLTGLVRKHLLIEDRVIVDFVEADLMDFQARLVDEVPLFVAESLDVVHAWECVRGEEVEGIQGGCVRGGERDEEGSEGREGVEGGREGGRQGGRDRVLPYLV